jgi:uncharacterized glyoxalase superfamily protein PhnB
VSQFRFVMGSDRYDDSVAFYGGRLGLAVFDEWTEPTRGAIWRLADGLVEVAEPPAGEPAPVVGGVFLAVEVDDAQARHDELVARGVEITSPLAVQPWGHRSFEITDPNGLHLVLFEVIGEH